MNNGDKIKLDNISLDNVLKCIRTNFERFVCFDQLDERIFIDSNQVSSINELKDGIMNPYGSCHINFVGL